MPTKDAIDLIKEALQVQGRSMKWLSRETGIPYPSMSHYLNRFIKPKKPIIIAMYSKLGIKSDFFDIFDYQKNQHTA